MTRIPSQKIDLNGDGKADVFAVSVKRVEEKGYKGDKTTVDVKIASSKGVWVPCEVAHTPFKLMGTIDTFICKSQEVRFFNAGGLLSFRAGDMAMRTYMFPLQPEPFRVDGFALGLVQGADIALTRAPMSNPDGSVYKEAIQISNDSRIVGDVDLEAMAWGITLKNGKMERIDPRLFVKKSKTELTPAEKRLKPLYAEIIKMGARLSSPRYPNERKVRVKFIDDEMKKWAQGIAKKDPERARLIVENDSLWEGIRFSLGSLMKLTSVEMG